MYDIRGKLVHSFLIIDFSTQGDVLECLFWGDGVVAMTSDMQIFVAEVCRSFASVHPKSGYFPRCTTDLVYTCILRL